MNRRTGINIFIDMILSLEKPLGITELGSKMRMDNRLTRRNVNRLTEIGLISTDHTGKISLTGDGVIIHQILDRNRK